MATILAEERQSGGMIREHGGLNRGTKDLGMTLPLFKGNQTDWKSWNKKFRTFLNQQRQDDGKPYIYVIVDLAKENQSVQDLCKGTKLSGKNYEEDNFKVSQWLQMALADGSALIFVENHDGDGRSGYKELLVIYQNDENKINRLQELWNKLKVIQFRGVKNYPWTKFGNTLETIYKEMETIRKLVDKEVQVQHLMEAVVYPPYKHILADVLFACPEAKKNLSQAMGLVTTKATYYGTVLGDVSKSMAGTAVGASATSDTQSIHKLKQQVKILKKKAPSASKQEGGKAGGEDDKNYIPPAVMDAVRKEGGKNAGRMISWMLKGRTQAHEADKCYVKGVKGSEDDKDDDDIGSEEGDDAEEVEAKSASSSMGRKSQNQHPDNPNPKRPRKINTICTVSMQVKKAQTIEHPANYKKLCWVEVDSRANTCCAGATFKLITDTGRTADVEGFHGDLGKLEGIPIGTCYTAIDHPVLQETIIGVFHQCLYFGSQMEESLINPNQL